MHHRSPLVIVSTTGTGGDVQPFITLSQGLRDRGHRVLMLVPRFQAEAVRVAGLPHESFGSDEQVQAVLGNPDLWDERKGWGLVWSNLALHLDVIRDVVQGLPADQPCVVLSHPILVPMAALARSVRPDLRIVAAYLAPSNLCSSHDLLTVGSLAVPRWIPLSWRQSLWRLIHRRLIDPVSLPGLNAARSRLGLPRVAGFFEHLLQAPDASVGLFPTWFAPAQPDWPQPFAVGNFLPARLGHDAPTGLPSDLEQFLSGGDPPIVFTAGTGHQHAARYFSAALEALKRLSRRGLFITTHAAQVPPALPPTVMWQAHVPFATLFPRAAAVVHHGGIGTTAEAFRAGVPQLVVPFAYDQFDNGLRAKRLGVADVMQAKRLSVRRLTRQLDRLLASPQVGPACRAVAEMMKQDSGMTAVLLERLEIALGVQHGAAMTEPD